MSDSDVVLNAVDREETTAHGQIIVPEIELRCGDCDYEAFGGDVNGFNLAGVQAEIRRHVEEKHP